MMYSPKELYILNLSLKTQLDNQGNVIQRLLSIDDLKMGMEINDKLIASTEGENKVFKESEVDFTTSEKGLLIRLIQRPWSAEDASFYFSVKDKLEK